MAANKNVFQLPQQSGTPDPTSVLYAATGGNTDTGLPLSVLLKGNIPFTQSGTGAVTSTVQAKLVVLSPEDFGATGDGVTDDTNALQTWFNNLTAGKQGVCTAGKVYGFTNLTLPSPAPYIGTSHDPSRTFGMVINGQNAVLKKLSVGTDPTYGIASIQWLNDVNGVNSPIHMFDLNIDLNGFATKAGIITQHWNSLFERVNVFNAVGDGFLQAGATKNGTNVTSALNNNNWVACDFYSNGGSGLHVSSPGLNNNADGILDRCRAFDNAKSNVNIEICSGWNFTDLHCWNFVVTQTDLGVTRFGATNATRWTGCEFDLDGNNLNTPSCYVGGGTTSLAGTFSGCYFYSPLSLNNAQSFRVTYGINSCQFKSTYCLFNSTFISVVSTGSLYLHATPFLSNVATSSPNASTAVSKSDFWLTQQIKLDGQHLLTKGASAPFAGGYAYEPLLSHKYDVVSGGGTYSMGYTDPLWQIISGVLTSGIIINLPPKANISDFQKPFTFTRQAGATGGFNVAIVDVDTSTTIATLSVPSTTCSIGFDGTNWKLLSQGSIDAGIHATTGSFTGALTPSQTAGIVGTTTNNNANAGSVGESIANTATGVSLTTNVQTNITSVSLTAGDWDVSGTVHYVPAGTTTVLSIFAGVNTVSATLGGLGTVNGLVTAPGALATGSVQNYSSPVVRFSLAATTTVFLVGASSFGVSTMTADGLIRARRVR